MAIALITATFTASPASAAANSCPKYEPLLRKHFPAKVVPVMSRIMYRESRCTPKAIGWNYRPGTGASNCKLAPAATYRKCKAVKSYDIGLLQINSTWLSVTRAVCKKQDIIRALQDPSCNVRVARYLYDNGGLGHWRATSGS
jgi:hypothetical protein